MLENGTLRISGKVFFPLDRGIYQNAFEATKVVDPAESSPDFRDAPVTVRFTS